MRKTALLLPLVGLLAWSGVHAEKADRSKQMVIEANQPGTLDMARQVVVFAGSVVVA
jgi:lipopolysaccharide export system protein LptA